MSRSITSCRRSVVVSDARCRAIPTTPLSSTPHHADIYCTQPRARRLAGRSRPSLHGRAPRHERLGGPASRARRTTQRSTQTTATTTAGGGGGVGEVDAVTLAAVWLRRRRMNGRACDGAETEGRVTACGGSERASTDQSSRRHCAAASDVRPSRRPAGQATGQAGRQLSVCLSRSAALTPPHAHARNTSTVTYRQQQQSSHRPQTPPPLLPPGNLLHAAEK